jgi:hypothetical protein
MDLKLTSDRLQGFAISHNLRSLKVNATLNNYKLNVPTNYFIHINKICQFILPIKTKKLSKETILNIKYLSPV